MNLVFLSIGSFDANYSDYHLMRDVLAAFLAAGHRVVLIQKQYAPAALVPEVLRPYAESGALVFENVPFARAPRTSFAKRYLADLRYYAHACRLMSRRRAWVEGIFLQSNNTAFLPVHWAKKHGVPLLYSEQDIFPQNAAAAGMLSRRSFAYRAAWALQCRAYKGASHVVTISDDMRGTILAAGVPPERVSVIWNWGHSPQPVCIAAENNAFLAQYPQPAGVFRAVYAGNLGTMQNVGLLLDAAALLRAEKDVRFFLIGDGARREALLTRAKALGLDNVTFLRMFPAEQALDLYAMADVNLVPLAPGVIRTALPSKLADCLAAGRPVLLCIDADARFAAEAARHACARVTPPDDPALLAKAILVLKAQLTGPDADAARARIAQDSAVWFAQSFAKEENVQQYVRLAQRVLTREA